jgi:hypothetical protein
MPLTPAGRREKNRLRYERWRRAHGDRPEEARKPPVAGFGRLEETARKPPMCRGRVVY